MDYVLNVYKENEFLFAIGGKHMNYDNVIWWQLKELIKLINEAGETSSEELLTKITNNSEYFKIVLDKEYEGQPILDLSNKTIGINNMNLYDFNEVTFNNCERELVWVNDELMIKYDGEDEPFDIKYIEFDLELLMKETMTFGELLIVAEFINKNIVAENVDLIINNKKVLLLSCI